MQIAAFVAVVRPNISGKETRGCPPYGLSVRAVQEYFQVSGAGIVLASRAHTEERESPWSGRRFCCVELSGREPI